MTAGLNSRRRPPPIQIPKLGRRQSNREDEREATVKGTPSSIPVRTPAPTPSPTRASTPSLLFSIASPSNIATGNSFSPVKEKSTQTPTRPSLTLRTTSLPLAGPATRPSTTPSITTKPPQSPTKTSFVTVTQTLQSPREKQETPGATQTVFVSGIPQVVTVTAAPQVTDPSGDGSGGISNTQRQGALPPGAVKPLIAHSYVDLCDYFSLLQGQSL